MTRDGKVNAGKLSDLAPGRCHSLRANGRTLVLVRDSDQRARARQSVPPHGISHSTAAALTTGS